MFNKIIGNNSATILKNNTKNGFTKDIQEAVAIASSFATMKNSAATLLLEPLLQDTKKAALILGQLHPKQAGAILAKSTPSFCAQFLAALDLHALSCRLELSLAPDMVTLFLRTDKERWADILLNLSDNTAAFLISHISSHYQEHTEAIRSFLLGLPQEKRTSLIAAGVSAKALGYLFKSFNTFHVKLMNGIN